MPDIKQFKVGIKNNVTASMDDNALELCFYDTIQDAEYFDWNTMQIEEVNLVSEIISQIKYYEPSRINMEIDCLGGNLGKAIAIYNFLKDYPARIDCKIIGFCASSANVLSCAASKGKLTMPKNGFYISHASSSWGVGGTSKDLREAADVNDRFTQQMAEILAARNTKGHTADEIMTLWADGDCWMNGTEACEYGFVDACYNEAAIVTARIDEAKSIYKNKPVTAEVEPELSEETSDSIIQTLKNEYMKFSDKVTAFLAGKKVTAKVTNDTIDVTATIEPLFIELTAQMQTEVTAEIETVTAKVTADVTASVTAALKAEFDTKITALTTENAGYKKSIDDLTADLTAIAGKESKPGKTEVTADGKKEKYHMGMTANA